MAIDRFSQRAPETDIVKRRKRGIESDEHSYGRDANRHGFESLRIFTVSLLDVDSQCAFLQIDFSRCQPDVLSGSHRFSTGPEIRN